MTTTKLHATLTLAIAGLIGLAAFNAGAEETEDAPKPINATCPLSGKDVDTAETSVYKVEFCCNNCKGKFEKDPGKYMADIAEAEDGACIISGRKAKVSTDMVVAFCCGNCKGKFDKDPKKYVGKVAVAESN